MKNIILTGDRPTGKLHIGHYVGSLRERLRLQAEGAYDEFFIMVADAQALTDNADNPEKIRRNVIEVMLDYLAIGLDPSKVTFFIQSEVAALPELTAYYMNLVPLSRLLRNPTVKSELSSRKFSESSGRSVPVGFINYPVSQAADITAFKANLVPVGIDQEPMLEQTREIVRTFNRTYKTDALVECKSILASNEASMRLPGVDGNEKMSKSLGNGIMLSDEPDVVADKINSIVTFPRSLSDPGILDGNVLFIYLEAFCRDEDFANYYPEFSNLDELKAAYAKGGIGDRKIKDFLTTVILNELNPIRERRLEWAKRAPEIIEILQTGSARANTVANATLKEVKHAMLIDYFDGGLIASDK